MAETSLTVRDKVVLVTGANRGIGFAFCQGLVERHGAKKVYAAVRNVESARSSMQELLQDRRVQLIYLDVTQSASIQTASRMATDVQIVISNAGILSNNTTPTDGDDAIAQLQAQLDVNCFGVMRLAQHFGPILQANGNGNGVFCQINSVASLRCTMPGLSTYCASKAAAYSITQALYHMWSKPQASSASDNNIDDTTADSSTRPRIHVMSVHPGPIATDMIAQASAELCQMAEPPSQVVNRVVQAMERGEFHVYPDSKSLALGQVYESYGKRVVEEGMMYG